MKTYQENLLFAEELLRDAKADLYAARIMGISRKKALEIYHIEQAVEKLQRGIYSMYGVPYAGDIKTHVPSAFHRYVDNLISTIGQEEKTILDRDKIDDKDTIFYSKNYTATMKEISDSIAKTKQLEYLDAAQIRKITTSFFFSKLMVSKILLELLNVKLFDKNDIFLQNLPDDDKLKVIHFEKNQLRVAFLTIDKIPFMISNIVIKNYIGKMRYKVTDRDLENPSKLINKGLGLFEMDDVLMLMQAQQTRSLAEIAFIHYITYPHMNPSRYPTRILNENIWPIDYEKNKFTITSFSKELISRTSKNLKMYEGNVKFLKRWYKLK